MSSVIGQTNSVATDGSILLPAVPCESLALVGHWVRMNGSGIAIRAQADSTVNSNVLGVIVAKLSATSCNVRVLGVTTEIFSGLDETLEYYLSETVAGEMETFPPTGPGSIILKLGQPFSMTRFFVHKGIRIRRA